MSIEAGLFSSNRMSGVLRIALLCAAVAACMVKAEDAALPATSPDVHAEMKQHAVSAASDAGKRAVWCPHPDWATTRTRLNAGAASAGRGLQLSKAVTLAGAGAGDVDADGGGA